MANVCTKCGNNLYGNKTKCPFCGEPISSMSRNSNKSSSSRNNLSSSNYNNNSYSFNDNNQPNNSQPTPRPATSYDSGSGGWGLLGFCFPIVGVILYLVWQKEKPNTARVCLNGALIGFVVGFIGGLFNACASIAS